MHDHTRDYETGQLIQSAAGIYETFFVPALFGEWPARLLEYSNLSQDCKLLDVACGTGVLAREAANQCTDVTGFDLNAEMLAIARIKDERVRWEEGNAESLPYADATFDIVASQFGLMFFDDKVKAITEQYRVLKPGGRLVTAVWGSIDDAPGYVAMKTLGTELFGAHLSLSFDAPFVLGDRDELLSFFHAAGVDRAEIHTLTGEARYPSIDDWVFTDIKGWTLAGALNDDEFDLLLDRARSDLQSFVQSDGSVAFPIPAHVVCAIKS